MSAKGNIVGIRPDGSHYRFAAAYARQHPMEVQIALESDKDLTTADVRSLMAKAQLPYGATVMPCGRYETCIGSGGPGATRRSGDPILGSGLAVSNAVNATLNPVYEASGQEPLPIVDPLNENQRRTYDRTGQIITAVTVPAAVATGLNGLQRTGTPRFAEPAEPFEQLRQARVAMRLPEAGSAGDSATVAKLEIGGEEFMGVNAHGQNVTLRVNAISKTHAETEAFQHAYEAGVRADTARLYMSTATCALPVAQTEQSSHLRGNWE